jgi:hypothetical protein
MGNAPSIFAPDDLPVSEQLYLCRMSGVMGEEEAAGEQTEPMEISDSELVLQHVEQHGGEFLQLDECVERLREQHEERKRQSHHRTTDMWTTVWGRMLNNPALNEPTSWEHRSFMRRFRLPYQLFKQVSE